MYTGKTGKPCCLCGNPETVSRLDIPPRAVQLLDNSGPIAWQDIEGEVSVYFCDSDWETVIDLVLDAGMSPLPRCNAARADFDLRADFEALLNDIRDEPDQEPLEREMLAEAERDIEEYDEDSNVELRDLVEARVVTWAMEDLRTEA
ncbi:hypothetical protein [Halorientalis litorea]|jgi:hypothetical protein|uniref:hypothetical protein n=1 Tax=Halorientalis litorea TaxID=2931977 RepID=UPI001FF113E1|nr:hypothetical protein [Halorientalis litorea]